MTEENNPCVNINTAQGAEVTVPPQVIQGTFNLGNWMTAYQATLQQNATAVRIQAQIPKKEEPVVEEKFEGGWKSEGKEKPVSPLICPRCQWSKKNEQMAEPKNDLWCDSCLKGETLGHDPDKSYRPPTPKIGDKAANLNQTFFG